ncbi:MAG: hypothetical protein ACHQF3_16205 [Alphaproteobacteria bacterium]
MTVVRARLGPILLLAATAALGACGGGDKKEPPPDPRAPPANSSATFKEGYEIGCPAGIESASASSSGWTNAKSDPRYASDLEFKKGWDQGFFTCQSQARNKSLFGGLNPF